MLTKIGDMAKLRELLRDRANVQTAKEFGEKLGLSRQQAAGLWSGRDPLGLRLMRLIKDAYGISLDVLAEVDEAVKGERRAKPANPTPKPRRSRKQPPTP